MSVLKKVQAETAPEIAEEAQGAPGFTPAPPQMPAALSSGVLWVPTEWVHVMRVSLPVKRQAARLKALPYAIEPSLGQPVDTVHVALGSALEGSEYLAAAIDRGVMQAFTHRCNEERGGAAKLVPDIFMLPAPTHAGWTVGEIEGRALVRTPCGAGFATRCEHFGAFHTAAGSPDCLRVFGSGARLPPMRGAREVIWPDASGLLDLRQGAFAPNQERRRGRAFFARRGAEVLAVFTLALGAEVWVVASAADARRTALAQALGEKYPSLTIGPSPARTIRSLAEASSAAAAGEFVSYFSQAAGFLDAGSGMVLRRADFSEREARFDLYLEAASVDALYEYSGRLNAAGLGAAMEEASAIPGGAEGRVSISAGAAAQ